MGLLDALSSDNGLLGLALLSAGSAKPVRTGLGEGLLGGLQLVQQQRAQRDDREQRRLMMEMQRQQMQIGLDDRKRQQDLMSRRDQFLASIDPNQGPPMEATLPGAIRAGFSPQEGAALLPQQARGPEYKVVGGSLVRIGPDGVSEAYRAPKDAADRQSPLAQLIAEMNALPPNSPMRKVYEQAISKNATHSPPIQNINYGSPMPAVNPATGKVELVRPDNRGGMTFTGVEPPPQHRDSKLPAELQRMQIAGDSMVKLMDDYESMLKRHNPRDPTVQMNPTVRADMQALKRNIELQFKELQALGALAGPDIEIMRQSLADPFSFSGAYYGRDGLLAQVKRARDLVRTRSQAVMATQAPGAQPAASAPESDPLGLRGK